MIAACARAAVAVVMLGVLGVLGACPRVVSEPVDICGEGGGQGDRRCADRCEAIVAPYREPVSSPSPIVDAACRRQLGRIGCVCSVANAVDLFISDDVCGAEGRAGDCLYDPADFPGCVVDTAGGDDVCATVCADLDAARAADAAGRDDIVVADSACEGGCVCAIVVGDGCSRIFDAGAFEGPQPLPPSFTDAANCTVDAPGT